MEEGLIATRKTTVPEKAVKRAKQLASLGGRPRLIRGVLKEEFDVHLSRRQIAQTIQMAKLARNLIGAQYLEKFQHCMSDTDRIFAYLKSVGASYVALYHRKGDCDAEIGAVQKRRKTDGGSKNSSTSYSMNDVLIVENTTEHGQTSSALIKDKESDVMKYAVDTRKHVGAEDDQDVLVALVWTSQEGKQYFQAFPEQVSVDGTHKTNNEEWELITFSVKDMSGKQEIVIRCWAPNNRAWLFRWLFQTAVPALVGSTACKEVQLVITDGDSQECVQLEAAIELVFTSTKRRRCGWHIVDRGVVRILGCLGGRDHRNRKKVDDLLSLVKNWLYSLMKDIETIPEYKA